MTWKSAAIALEQGRGPGRPGVVERHERVVEDQRRPAVAGDEPDEPEPGDEVDEVERALAQRADRDPVVLLGGVDLDVQRLVVDPDAAVAAAGDRWRGRAPCAPRDSGSRSSSSPARPGRWRSSVIAKTRWRRCDAASCSRQAASRSAWRGDLLGVDAVGLDPGAGVRLVVAGPLEGRSPGRGPRPRAARGRGAPWRSARAPRARSSSARSRGPRRRAVSAASAAAPCRRARRAGRVRRSIWATCASSRASRSSAAARSARPSALELRLRLRLGLAQLRLHLRAAAQAPVDLDVAQLRFAS